MVFCSHCGKENDPGSNYCIFCGSKISSGIQIKSENNEYLKEIESKDNIKTHHPVKPDLSLSQKKVAVVAESIEPDKKELSIDTTSSQNFFFPLFVKTITPELRNSINQITDCFINNESCLLSNRAEHHKTIRKYSSLLDQNEKIEYYILNSIYLGSIIPDSKKTNNLIDKQNGPFLKIFEHYEQQHTDDLKSYGNITVLFTNNRIIFSADDTSKNPYIFSQVYYEMINDIGYTTILLGPYFTLDLISPGRKRKIKFRIFEKYETISALICYLASNRINDLIVYGDRLFDPIQNQDVNNYFKLENSEYILIEIGPVRVIDNNKWTGNLVHIYITNKRLQFFKSETSGIFNKKETGIGIKLREIPLTNINNVTFRHLNDLEDGILLCYNADNNIPDFMSLDYGYFIDKKNIIFTYLEHVFTLNLLRFNGLTRIKEFHYISESLLI